MAGRAKKPARRVVYHSSDTESEDDVLNRRRSRRANLPKNPNPPADIQDDTFVVGEDDFFEEGRDHYMKIATDVVDKNVKLTKLFDPDVMQGFTMIMNKSEKVGQATKAMEACTKVYTQKVDTLHTNVQKLSSTMVRIEEKPKRKEKRVAFEEKNLNDWLAEGADDLNNSGINDGIFSGEEDENRPIIRGAEMTVTGDFLRDQTLLPGSQDLDLSLTMDDDPESFHMGEKIQQFVNNRSLLTKGKKLTLEQLEVRFARADAAVERFNQIERIKK
uniref:Uncharacterized protein n=1 Tax=Panagrolaimus sp. JU765 TaxID=591449 RepID=A0AC34RSD5_9BILA